MRSKISLVACIWAVLDGLFKTTSLLLERGFKGNIACVSLVMIFYSLSLILFGKLLYGFSKRCEVPREAHNRLRLMALISVTYLPMAVISLSFEVTDIKAASVIRTLSILLGFAIDVVIFRDKFRWSSLLGVAAVLCGTALALNLDLRSLIENPAFTLFNLAIAGVIAGTSALMRSLGALKIPSSVTMVYMGKYGAIVSLLLFVPVYTIVPKFDLGQHLSFQFSGWIVLLAAITGANANLAVLSKVRAYASAPAVHVKEPITLSALLILSFGISVFWDGRTAQIEQSLLGIAILIAGCVLTLRK
ncbi:MAG: hypothetical protein H6619_05200 [Deltaproteobacteria bacterium]|nr:hypothetical protein [Deltaproteobacteria bacterium]